MRHVAGLIFAGLAACFATSAVILGWRIAGQAAGPPLNEYQTATLTAARASYFSPTRLTEITGANIEVMDTIRENADTGNSSIAIWDEFSSVYDTTNHQQLEPTSRTLVFDRKTAELINCCGENVNGNALIRQSGIAGYVFPAGTKKQTYDVFDTTLDKPEPFVYSGTDVIDGIRAYRFTENISAAKVGFSPLSSAEPELYSMHRSYWVDPETGALLKVNENEDLYLANAATGSGVTHLFDADLRTTPATVARLASQDARGRDEITKMKTVLFAVLGIAGGLAVTAWFLLTRKPWLLLTRKPWLLLTRRPRLRRLMPSRSPLFLGDKGDK
jgi:Porin PorA